MISKNTRDIIIPTLLAIAFAILAWVRLIVQNSDLLFEAQEQSLWLPGSLFMQDMLQQPGGWFNYVGRYLTQYFYYPAIGASILIILWLSIYVLTLFAFRLKWYLSWVAMIVPMLLLWAETSIGYAVYISKVPEVWFAPSLFVTFIALLLAVAQPFNLWIRTSWQAVVIITGCVLVSQWREQVDIPQSLFTPFHGSLEDARFHTELRMDRAIEEGNWKEALNELRNLKEPPTRQIWMLKNVALLQQGRLGDNWLNYPSITTPPSSNDSIIVPIVLSSGPLIYFHHGSIQFAYRWSIENMVEFGATNKRLRMMIRCALIKEEWDLAEKYISMLSRTTFHKEWAEEQRKFLHHPELLAKDPYYRIPLAISQTRTNLLDGDNSLIENYLISNYSQSSMHSCPELAELGVVYAMQTQNINNFWNQFYIFADIPQNRHMPISFQEAIYLFIQLEPASAPKHDFPFDPIVVESYKNFQTRSQQLMKMGYNDEALAKAMYREFGKTYYWFYFFCRNQKTY